jgi:hypothetical protein
MLGVLVMTRVDERTVDGCSIGKFAFEEELRQRR